MVTQDEANSGPARVYAIAFNPPGRLHWPNLSPSEQIGRASLFTGTVSAYRNPRAHRELDDQPDAALRELLLINHLFRLEAEAEVREPVSPVEITPG
ncbi:TIGR02391 family protein [Sphingomonas rosea]